MAQYGAVRLAWYWTLRIYDFSNQGSEVSTEAAPECMRFFECCVGDGVTLLLAHRISRLNLVKSYPFLAFKSGPSIKSIKSNCDLVYPSFAHGIKIQTPVCPCTQRAEGARKNNLHRFPAIRTMSHIRTHPKKCGIPTGLDSSFSLLRWGDTRNIEVANTCASSTIGAYIRIIVATHRTIVTVGPLMPSRPIIGRVPISLNCLQSAVSRRSLISTSHQRATVQVRGTAWRASKTHLQTLWSKRLVRSSFTPPPQNVCMCPRGDVAPTAHGQGGTTPTTKNTPTTAVAPRKSAA